MNSNEGLFELSDSLENLPAITHFSIFLFGSH